jgi:hypothetical protein
VDFSLFAAYLEHSNAWRVPKGLVGRRSGTVYATPVHAAAEICLRGTDFGEEHNGIRCCEQPL